MDHSEHEMDHGEHGEHEMDHGEHGEHDMDHGEEAQASGSGDDDGFAALANGHHHDIVLTELTPRQEKKLEAQLAVTRQVAKQYPTVADAMAAGYRRAGPYSPGLGTHLVLQNGQGLNPDGVMDEEDLRHPLSIIYSGHEPDDHVVGFMYYSLSQKEPEGFAGDNDFWHYHTSVCVVRGADGGIDAPYGADRDVPEKLCKKAGGYLLKQTQWMVHVWSVPGYEMSDEHGGVFGEVNPKIACDDGTYHQVPMRQWPKYRYNVCKSNPA
jgi:hypothetical protein